MIAGVGYQPCDPRFLASASFLFACLWQFAIFPSCRFGKNKFKKLTITHAYYTVLNWRVDVDFLLKNI